MKDLIVFDVVDMLPPPKKNFFERTYITRNLTNHHVFDFGRYTKRFYTENEGDVEKVIFHIVVNNYKDLKHNIKNLGKFVLNGGCISFVLSPSENAMDETILIASKITLPTTKLSYRPNDEDTLVDLQNLLTEHDFPLSFWGEE